MTTEDIVDKVTKELIDKGLLIEAGWESLRIMGIPPDASPQQLKEMRKAYFVGAQHLLASIMSCLDPGHEPTEDDMRRMNSIYAELKSFYNELKSEVTKDML